MNALAASDQTRRLLEDRSRPGSFKWAALYAHDHSAEVGSGQEFLLVEGYRRWRRKTEQMPAPDLSLAALYHLPSTTEHQRRTGSDTVLLVVAADSEGWGWVFLATQTGDGHEYQQPLPERRALPGDMNAHIERVVLKCAETQLTRPRQISFDAQHLQERITYERELILRVRRSIYGDKT